MTIDTERWDNINWTRDFLRELAVTIDAKKMDGTVVRNRAAELLKHYPEDWWVEQERERGK